MFSAIDVVLHLSVVLCFAASLLSSGVVGVDMTGNCSLCEVPKHNGHKETLEMLKPLCGKRFSTKDGSGEFEYNIGICVGGELGETDENLKGAGAIQTDTKDKDKPVKTMIGDIKHTEVMSGTNWIYLEYEGGSGYNSHCQGEARRTVIMINCDPGETEGNLRWLEENRNKSGDCYYLFELEHSGACSKAPVSNDLGLSPGSIICITIGSVIGAYLVFGILFMRFVRGAKGYNQIPNYEFWRDFGSLQADGCDLICRCSRSRYKEAKPYHGIGDHQIESANDGEDLDEHLLPM